MDIRLPSSLGLCIRELTHYEETCQILFFSFFSLVRKGGDMSIIYHNLLLDAISRSVLEIVFTETNSNIGQAVIIMLINKVRCLKVIKGGRFQPVDNDLLWKSLPLFSQKGIMPIPNHNIPSKDVIFSISFRTPQISSSWHYMMWSCRKKVPTLQDTTYAPYQPPIEGYGPMNWKCRSNKDWTCKKNQK